MFHSGGWNNYLKFDSDEARGKIDRNLLRRVWSYAASYRWGLTGILATIFLISGLHVIPPILTRTILDEAIPNQDLQALTWLGLAMLLVPVVSSLVGIMQRWWSSRIGEGIIFDLRCSLYEHVQNMSIRFFTMTRSGELISRLSSDVVGAQQAITGTFVSIISNVVTVLVILAVMMRSSVLITIVALCAFPLFVLPARGVARILRRVAEAQMDRNASMSAILAETFNVSGALLVKLFNRRDHEATRFALEASQVRDLGVRRAMIGRWFFAGLGLISAVGSALVFWVGGYMVIKGTITVGTVVMFSTLLGQLYGPLQSISNSRVEFATSLVSFERVFEVLDLPIEIAEIENPVRLTSLNGKVEFENVSFSYRNEGIRGLEGVKRLRLGGGGGGGGVIMPFESGPSEFRSSREWALEDISFVVEPGMLVALVGPSGAGKTTVSYLVPRLYDVTRGVVRIDGHDIRDLALGAIAENVGVVTQETYLFHDTIRANLLYARPDATHEEVEDACLSANIHDFIVSLEAGYDTVVGERGHRLSGGERQRLAIARVLLKDPRILILDEATSHLDTRSEALIQDALERLMEKRTSIVIAHRLSTVHAADRILVLDAGRLVESGTNDELIAMGGLYATLHESQFRSQTVETED